MRESKLKNRKPNYKKSNIRGMLLVWVSVCLLMIGIFATHWAKTLSSRKKAGYRTVVLTQQEASEIECPDECKLGNLILSRVKTVIENEEFSNKSFCGLTPLGFKTQFNSPKPQLVFPLPTIPIRIENDPDVEYALKGLKSSLAGTPADFQPELKNLIDSCRMIQVPETPLNPGFFKFCIGLDMTGHPDAQSKSNSFPTAQYVMAEVEVGLVKKILAEDQKDSEVLQNCSDWSKEISGRHFKFVYRIFWKAYRNSEHYFSWKGKVTVPWYEVRSE